MSLPRVRAPPRTYRPAPVRALGLAGALEDSGYCSPAAGGLRTPGWRRGCLRLPRPRPAAGPSGVNEKPRRSWPFLPKGDGCGSATGAIGGLRFVLGVNGHPALPFARSVVLSCGEPLLRSPSQQLPEKSGLFLDAGAWWGGGHQLLLTLRLQVL